MLTKIYFPKVKKKEVFPYEREEELMVTFYRSLKSIKKYQKINKVQS